MGEMYILKMCYIRDPGPRSMFTPDHEKFQQVVHFRYLWFQKDGSVQYVISPEKPKVVRQRLLADCREKMKEVGFTPNENGNNNDNNKSWRIKRKSNHLIRPPTTHWGEFFVRKGSLEVLVPGEYKTIIRFKFLLGPSKRGAHDRLTMLNHQCLGLDGNILQS